MRTPQRWPARQARARGARTLAAAVVVACVAALSGCGDDDEPDTTTTIVREKGKEPRILVSGNGAAFDPQAVYRRAAPGVVTVLSVFEDEGGLLGIGPRAGQGAGFVLNESGEIATNAHVVTDGEGGEFTEADEVYVEFGNRDRVPAEIVGFDPFADVGLLRVDPGGLNLVPLELGDDTGIQVGQPVAAIGTPFGETLSLSTGIISALERSVRSLTDFQIDNAIQTDAPINPGNSGGPLLDARGRVLGINQQIETRSGTNAGVAFAVPVSVVRRSLEQLREEGEVSYAFIGVSTQALYPQLAERLDLDTDYGGLIATVVPDGPADDAGIRGGERFIRFQATRVSIGGDVILAVDGKRVIDPNDLAQYISAARPGEDLTLELLRDGERREVDVTLGERPTTVPN